MKATTAKEKLNKSLVVILVSNTIAFIVMIIVAFVIDEPLFAIAGVLFILSGIAAIYVIRALKAKIG